MAIASTHYIGQRSWDNGATWHYITDGASAADIEASDWWQRAQKIAPATWRIVPVDAIEFEDGDVIEATWNITRSNRDGIDRTVGQRPVRGVVRVIDGMTYLDQPYVVLRKLALNGVANVLSGIRVVGTAR